MNANMKLKSPPKAHLAVRVGVTGHRPAGLENADIGTLGTRINEVLRHIRGVANEVKSSSESLYADGGPPALRVISPLAEGADMLVAEEALGYLDAPVRRICALPAPHAFSPSLDHYLLPSAERIVKEIAELVSGSSA